MTSRQVSEVSENGSKSYGRKYSSYTKPKEEWIAVPDSGVLRGLVDAARSAIEDNRVPSRAGERFWELSGSIGCCGECGRRLRVVHRTKQRKSGPRTYGYYRCPRYVEHGGQGCTNHRRMVSAASLEAKAWRFVRGVMLEPEELTKDFDRMIELKRKGMRGDPQREAKTWLEEIAKLERMRDG